MTRTPTPVSFTLELSGRTGPRTSQVARALVEAIASGQVHDGDRLPSTRTLAATFGLARTAVVGAYEELTAAGFLVARPGGATYVEQGAAAAARAGAFGSRWGQRAGVAAGRASRDWHQGVADGPAADREGHRWPPGLRGGGGATRSAYPGGRADPL